MKIVFRIAAVILFVLFFGFALKNTQEVALRYFLGYEMRGPLVLLLLGFFCAGAALGILAILPTLVRQRRELAAAHKRVAGMEQERAVQMQARVRPPQPDSVINQ
jgi:lipopolysaccharide assembly protein A